MTTNPKGIEIIPTITHDYYVSGITENDMRWGSSTLHYDTLEQAREFINSEEGLTYARNHKIVQYRISRIIEISDDDIEVHQLPEGNLQ